MKTMRSLLIGAAIFGFVGNATAEEDYPKGHWKFNVEATVEGLKGSGKPQEEIDMVSGFLREAYIDFTEETIFFAMAKELPLATCEWDVENDNIKLTKCIDPEGKPSSDQVETIKYLEWMDDGTLSIHQVDGIVLVYNQ
ncbi:hypothetical protein G3A39_41225 [Paraburkholderia aspalathi]|nr:hypothetical protein [Paraburkholderia aspalathi]